MIRARTPLVLALALFGCHPKDGKTENPTGGETDGPPKVVIDDSVKQEPDPPQLAEAQAKYLVGDYETVVALLQPVYDDLKARNQYRASAFAATWLTLAHAEQVFENGKEPSEWAAAMAEATADSEVAAAAKLARGAYLIGDQEFASAASTLDEAAKAAKTPSLAALAHVLRAEALINGAFQGGEDESLQHPEMLDEAKAAYDAAAALAKGDDALSLVLARAHEGYAALANYRKQHDEVCSQATIAIQLYAAKGATRLLQVPAELASDNKCPLPPEATASADAG